MGESPLKGGAHGELIRHDPDFSLLALPAFSCIIPNLHRRWLLLQFFYSYFPYLSGFIIFGLTLLLMSVVYLCLRHTGRQIERTHALQGYRRYLWISSFLLLFLFSGYGFLTSSLLLVEGPVIVREGLLNNYRVPLGTQCFREEFTARAWCTRISSRASRLWKPNCVPK